MALSNQKVDFKGWEAEVSESHPKKEYQGVFEAVLHLKATVGYLESETGKKVVIDELGELKYDLQLDLQKKSLKTREAELKFLKGLFK